MRENDNENYSAFFLIFLIVKTTRILASESAILPRICSNAFVDK